MNCVLCIEKTAVTGGIGAGKSVVCRMLTAMGYPVYDTDLQAKRIINEIAEVRALITEHISERAFSADGVYDRAHVAAVVFADSDKLAKLNRIVHTAVADDLTRWMAAQSQLHSRIFIETALLYSSGLYRLVESEWRVTAPEPVRVARVMERNAITADQVRARIAAQQSEYPAQSPLAVHTLVNDGMQPLVPQVLDLLGK